MKSKKSFREILFNSKEAYKHKTSFCYFDNENYFVNKTYNDLFLDVCRLSNYINILSPKTQNTAIISKNCYEWIVLAQSSLCGASPLFILDNENSSDWLKKCINDSDIKTLFFDEYAYDKVNDIHKELNVENYIKMGEFDTEFNCTPFNGILNNDKFENKKFLFDDYSNNDMRIIFSTSGTSGGYKKRVMLSANNLISNLNSYDEIGKLEDDLKHMMILPLHHSYIFMVNLIHPILRGHEVYITKGPQNIEKDMLFYSPNMIAIVPVLAKFLINGYKTQCNNVKAKTEYFGNNLIRLICGGAGISSELLKEFSKLNIELRRGYGITECSPLVAATEGTLKYDDKTVGLPLSCNEIIIQNGELWIKGDNVMIGYYNDPNSTAEVMSNGWFKTGDTGYIGDDGMLYITGRLKNVIVLNSGKNVFPEELEEYFQSINEVIDCIIFCQDDSCLSILAHVNLDEYKYADILNKIKKANKILPLYKQVKNICISELPLEKTSTNKIKRTNILEQFEYACLSNTIKMIISNRLFKEINLTLKTSLFEELEFDSLEVTYFIAEVDSLIGFEIPISEFKDFDTIKDVCDYVFLNHN